METGSCFGNPTDTKKGNITLCAILLETSKLVVRLFQNFTNCAPSHTLYTNLMVVSISKINKN